MLLWQLNIPCVALHCDFVVTSYISMQEREALEAQMEVERRIHEARIHEEESRRLQAELERARLEMEENQRALQEALASPKVLYVREHDDDNKSSGLFLSSFIAAAALASGLVLI
jgi:regulator of protease activity HflC (stomatin/prohibitin superfamily)